MKAVGKVAVKLYEYLGASKQAARTASKGTAKQFSQILSGKSRKEKKEFLKALERLADDTKKPGNASDIIFKTLTKGKEGNDRRIAVGHYNEITLRLGFRRSCSHYALSFCGFSY